MKKQIEEMTNDIGEKQEAGWKFLAGGYTTDVSNEEVAEHLVAKGWRKQSDTAREIFAEVGKILTAKYNSIQAGYHYRMRYGNVDTPQGMKELGELSGVRQVIAEIKAFEKKYTEANDAESN